MGDTRVHYALGSRFPSARGRAHGRQAGVRGSRGTCSGYGPRIPLERRLLHRRHLGLPRILPGAAARRGDKNWLVPHLVSRIAYTGSGGLDPLSPGIRLSISPRVAHIDHVVSAESTSSRGIFHTRDESLATGYTRIHVLAGDNACSQRSTWLKIGTTALIVAFADAEGSDAHWITLLDPVEAMQGFARDVRHRTKVRLKRGSTVLMTAVEIQRWLLSRIEVRAGGDRFPDWAAAVCDAWKQALDLIESPAIEHSHALDWPLKFGLFRREIVRRGFTEPVISAWSEALERLSRSVPPDAAESPALGPVPD